MPSNGTLIDNALDWRRQLLAGEKAQANDLIKAYTPVWERTKRDLAQLLAQIERAREAGEEVNEAWLFQADRLAQLERQIEGEVTRYTTKAAGAISSGQELGVGLAAGQVTQTAQLAGVSFAALPANQVQLLVGFLADGSPVSSVLAKLGPVAAGRVREALITGVALGWNPRRMEREARDVMGQVLSHTLRVLRTESLRAFRTYNHLQWQANRDIVTGWRWISAADARTCASCWAMHGTIHSVDETLNDHPNGRCVAAPMVKGFTPSSRPTGVEMFENMRDEEKRRPGSTDLNQILSPKKYDAFMSGQVEPAQFSHQTSNAVWGSTRREASLEQMLGR